jgi:hypothetical protein
VTATGAGNRTVVIDCMNKPQVWPSSFVLTCADANDALSGLTWTTWTPARATATGTEQVNDCRPNCAEGTFHSYPVQAVLSGAAPVPHHPGERRFTKLTRHYPGARPPHYNGHKWVPGPRTVTIGLWS